MQTQDTTPKKYTRSQAAAYLGVKAGTLSNWASTHRYSLPYIKFGRKVMYLKTDLDAFLKKHTYGIAKEGDAS